MALRKPEKIQQKKNEDSPKKQLSQKSPKRKVTPPDSNPTIKKNQKPPNLQDNSSEHSHLQKPEPHQSQEPSKRRKVAPSQALNLQAKK